MAWLIAFGLFAGAIVAIAWLTLLWSTKPTSEHSQKKLKTDDAEDDDTPLDKEAWAPQLEIKDWQEALPGSPWNFDGCDSIEDVIKNIWKFPIPTDLQQGYNALLLKVRDIKIARSSWRNEEESQFSVVYVLNTGAELFGGPPVEHTVGVELAEELSASVSPDSSSGLRSRRGGGGGGSSSSRPAMSSESAEEMQEAVLPCLSSFFRIHDGFGVLISRKHLPLLLQGPGDHIHGSCYYVYPRKGLETIDAGGSPLVRMGRVDKACVVCVRPRAGKNAGLVYVEKDGTITEDDEPPLSFIADTVSNISGLKVVPSPYEGGPSLFSAMGGH